MLTTRSAIVWKRSEESTSAPPTTETSAIGNHAQPRGSSVSPPRASTSTAIKSASRSVKISVTPGAIGMPTSSRPMYALSTSPTLPGVTVIVIPEKCR